MGGASGEEWEMYEWGVSVVSVWVRERRAGYHCSVVQLFSVFSSCVVSRFVASPRGVIGSDVTDSSGEALRMGRYPAQRVMFLVGSLH